MLRSTSDASLETDAQRSPSASGATDAPTGWKLSRASTMTRERLYLYDTTCATGSRARASISRSRTRSRIAAGARRARDRLCRGRLARGEPDRQRVLRRRRRGCAQATLTAFGMTKRSGRSAANDDVLAAVVNAGTPAVCLVGKTHDFHVAHRARDPARGEPRQHRRRRSRIVGGAGPRGAVRRRAFLRRLEGEPRLRAGLPEGGARTPGRAGWCSATPTAARCRTRSAAVDRAR